MLLPFNQRSNQWYSNIFNEGKLVGSIEGQIALAVLSTLLDGLPRLQILHQVSQSPDRVRNFLDNHLSLSFLVRPDFHNDKISDGCLE